LVSYFCPNPKTMLRLFALFFPPGWNIRWSISVIFRLFFLKRMNNSRKMRSYRIWTSISKIICKPVLVSLNPSYAHFHKKYISSARISGPSSSSWEEKTQAAVAKDSRTSAKNHSAETLRSDFRLQYCGTLARIRL
jgi:hypothetical protein